MFSPWQVYGYLLSKKGVSTASDITDDLKVSLYSVAVDCWKCGFMRGTFRGVDSSSNDFDGLAYARNRMSDYVGDLRKGKRQLLDTEMHAKIEKALPDAPPSLRIFLSGEKPQLRKREKEKKLEKSKKADKKKAKVASEESVDLSLPSLSSPALPVVASLSSLPVAASSLSLLPVPAPSSSSSSSSSLPVVASSSSSSSPLPVVVSSSSSFSVPSRMSVASAAARASRAPRVLEPTFIGVSNNNICSAVHKLVKVYPLIENGENPPREMYAVDVLLELSSGYTFTVRDVSTDVLCELYENARELLQPNFDFLSHWITVCDVGDDLSFRVGINGYPVVEEERYYESSAFLKRWGSRVWKSREQELYHLVLRAGATVEGFPNNRCDFSSGIYKIQADELNKMIQQWVSDRAALEHPDIVQRHNEFKEIVSEWNDHLDVDTVLNTGIVFRGFNHFNQINLVHRSLIRRKRVVFWSVGRNVSNGPHHRSILASAVGVVDKLPMNEINVMPLSPTIAWQTFTKRCLTPLELKEVDANAAHVQRHWRCMYSFGESTKYPLGLSYDRKLDRWYLKRPIQTLDEFGCVRTDMGSSRFIQKQFVHGFDVRLETFENKYAEKLCEVQCAAQYFTDAVFLPTDDPALYRPRYLDEQVICGSISAQPVGGSFYAPLSALQQQHHDAAFSKDHPGCAAGIGCLCSKEFFTEDDNPEWWRTVYFCRGFSGADHKRRCLVERIGDPSCAVTFLKSNGFNDVTFDMYHAVFKDEGGANRFCYAMIVRQASVRCVDQFMSDVVIALNHFCAGAYIPRLVRVVSQMPDISDARRMGFKTDIPTAFKDSATGFMQHSVYLNVGGKMWPLDAAVSMLPRGLEGFVETMGFKAVNEILYGLPCSVSEEHRDEPPPVWYHAKCAWSMFDVPDDAHNGAWIDLRCMFCREPMQSSVLTLSGHFHQGDPFFRLGRDGSIIKPVRPVNFDRFGAIDVVAGMEAFDLYHCRLPENLPSRQAMVNGHPRDTGAMYLFGTGAPFVPKPPKRENVERHEVTLVMDRVRPVIRSAVPDGPSVEAQIKALKDLCEIGQCLMCALFYVQKDTGEKFIAPDRISDLVQLCDPFNVAPNVFDECEKTGLIQKIAGEGPVRYTLKLSREAASHVRRGLQDLPAQIIRFYRKQLERHRFANAVVVPTVSRVVMRRLSCNKGGGYPEFFVEFSDGATKWVPHAKAPISPLFNDELFATKIDEFEKDAYVINSVVEHFEERVWVSVHWGKCNSPAETCVSVDQLSGAREKLQMINVREEMRSTVHSFLSQPPSTSFDALEFKTPVDCVLYVQRLKAASESAIAL